MLFCTLVVDSYNMHKDTHVHVLGVPLVSVTSMYRMCSDHVIMFSAIVSYPNNILLLQDIVLGILM